jgi:protein tyrosine phosphatase (PTP) superfamily phosphohydrolase (DUF442 family)
MNSAIKDTINNTAIRTFEEVGYDDERPVMAFSREGMRSVLNTAIRVCADQVSNPKERELILSLGE